MDASSAFILADEGREDPNTTKSGPSKTPFKRHFAGGPMMVQY